MAEWREILAELEAGRVRAAEKDNTGEWRTNTIVKEGILAAMRAGKNIALDGIYAGFIEKDTILPRKFTLDDRIRLVPGGSSVRRGAYLAPGVIVMPPAFVNVGAYIDADTMIDSHVLVGSCAQIGKRVHLSAGVQIGGVLEPIGQTPVVVEDDAFIGAGCVVVEGIRVSEQAVLAPGVTLSRGVAIYDSVHEKILERGAPVPPRAIVVPGTRPLRGEWAAAQGIQLNCPVIIKYRDGKSDAALQLEQALRA